MSDPRTLASGEVVVTRFVCFTLTTQRVLALQQHGAGTDVCEALQLAKVDYTGLRRKHYPLLLVAAILLGLFAANSMVDGEDLFAQVGGLLVVVASIAYWLTRQLELVIGTGGGRITGRLARRDANRLKALEFLDTVDTAAALARTAELGGRSPNLLPTRQ